MDLESLYQTRRATPWNINEHMDTLRRYASDCDVVTEFGVHMGFSTVAFLAGQPKELHSYDIRHYGEVDQIATLAVSETRTKFEFHLQSSLEAQFESTDLLFIDSLHQYDQVRQELEIHGHKVKKYLIFHDTLAWGYIDENPSDRPTDQNFGRAHKKGIGPAIGEYMEAHPEWTIHEHYFHNCGLTIYRRTL